MTYHIGEAINFAKKYSNDRQTQVGAVIHNGEVILAKGSNEFRCDFSEVTERMHERPLKYDHIFHAEDNALFTAKMNGVDVRGASLSCTHPSCASCAQKVIAAGIKTVYVQSISSMGEEMAARWKSSWLTALDLYTKAGVEVIEIL